MRAPRLMICGFGSFPAAPRNPSAAVVEALASQAWRPGGLDADYLTLPVAWSQSAEIILERLADRACEGVLLLGVAVDSHDFRVETSACNRATRLRADHLGEVWPSATILETGAAICPASAPCEAMLAAIRREGLPARLSDDAGDYLCNLVLYRLLAAQAAPAVGFLHVPQAREFAAGAAASLAQIERAVRAAATAFAQALRAG